MRVIGGKAKGHRLKVPRGRDVRPTAARVKEAIFNILPHNLSGYRVLDLFAGTGNLSVEALSRGAAEAVLVDISHKAEKAIRDNLEASRFSGSARVWAAPVFRSLRLLSRNGQRFDLIFLDPPYEKGWIRKIVSMIAQQGLLEEKGILVAEHSVREPVEEHYGLLALKDQRRYGTTLLSFFGYDQSPPFEPRRDE
jgi:16S rRNA (guanine(966)-N(2))-methyltransferase RsmD